MPTTTGGSPKKAPAKNKTAALKKATPTSDIFAGLKAAINKKVGGAHCEVMSESNIAVCKEEDCVKMPTYDLSRLMCGELKRGLPAKSLTLLVGVEHSFKSSLSILMARNALKNGYKPIIIDTEGGITNDFSKRWGLNTEDAFYVYSPWVEEVKGVLAQIKETGEEKYCIIIDSVGGLDKLKSYDDALKGDPKADMGTLARAIKSTLKLLVNIIKSQNSIGIITSHFYSQSGLIPMPDSVVGGKSVLLLPDIILYLKKGGKKDTNRAGSDKLINVLTIKNRFSPIDRQGVVEIDYENGINEMAGMIDLAIELEVVEQKGAHFYIDGASFHGIAAFNAALNENVKIRESMIESINTVLMGKGYSNFKGDIE
jgi:recombination protein RecA